MYGRKMSDETKQRISEANKGRLVGKNNPMYGKSARKGIVVSEEERRKLSAAQILRWKLIKSQFSSQSVIQQTLP